VLVRRRAEHVLRHLLGQSYSRQDMGFYGLALGLALLATALPGTAPARKWLLLLLAASLAAERCAARLFGGWLGLDVGRRLLLPRLLAIDYIWALRWWGAAGPGGAAQCSAVRRSVLLAHGYIMSLRRRQAAAHNHRPCTTMLVTAAVWAGAARCC
jgi:hypothetical protein